MYNIHNTDGNGQVSSIYTCIVEQMHINLSVSVSLSLCMFERYTMHTKWINNQNESMFTYIVHAYVIFSTSSHTNEFYMFLRNIRIERKKSINLLLERFFGYIFNTVV